MRVDCGPVNRPSWQFYGWWGIVLPAFLVIWVTNALTLAGMNVFDAKLLAEFGVHLPEALTNAPLGKGADNHLVATGALVNVPAVLIVALLTWVCYVGVKQSTRVNNVIKPCGTESGFAYDGE